MLSQLSSTSGSSLWQNMMSVLRKTHVYVSHSESVKHVKLECIVEHVAAKQVCPCVG